MIARAEFAEHSSEPHEDHYVHLRGVTWADYLRLLEVRGDRSVPRLTYLKGTLEIMSPSHTHELIKSYVGRLVEVWCLERGSIRAQVLRGTAYEAVESSEVLPGIDLEQLANFLDRPTASEAIREYRAALRAAAP